jgi:PmbA protein
MTETRDASISAELLPDLLNDIVQAARKAGADAAEAVFAERQSLSVSVRLGELEEVEREEARDLGLRVFIGARSATVSGSDISPEARAKLIERAVAMARLAPEDPYASLAPHDRLAKGPFPELDLIDPYEPTAETLETQARLAEEHARAVKGVTNSDGGSATWSSSRWGLVTTAGFHGTHAATGYSISASAIAGEGAGMERGGEGRSARHFGDLPAAGDIGMEAGRQAVARLNPRKIATTTAPVIFENRLAMSLIGPLLGAISGPAITRGASFLKDKLGHQIFAKGVNLLEDPHRVRGLGSAPFDDEGVATEARALFDDGVLTTWLLNSSPQRGNWAWSPPATRRAAWPGPPGVTTHNLHAAAGRAGLAGPDAGRRDGPAGHLDVRPVAERQHRRLVAGAARASGSRTARSPIRSPRSPWPAT